MITTMRGCVAHNDLWPWPISSRSFRHNFAIKLLKYVTSCRVRSTAYTVLYGFFPYLAAMTTSMRGCVMHNDLWSWPISSRSFGHDFVIKLLKYVTSCPVHSTAHTVLDGFFPYLAQMITSMRWCVACSGLWPWPVSSRSFSHDFAIKLLIYGTSCRVRSITPTVLNGFFPYLAQMITNMTGGVMHNDLWSRHISSKSFSHDFVIKLLKYGTSCHVHSIACTVLDGFSPYLALMITSMRGCVMQWPLTLTYIFKVI